MVQGVWLFLAFAAVLVFPSSNLELFDGLPVSRLPEFAALGLAVSFLLFPSLRARQLEFWKGRRIPKAALWTLLGGMLALKIILFASGEYSGFAGCYRSPAEPTAISHETLPELACERSYENLFGRFSATRLDQKIWFASDQWNLVFLNTNRYDYFDWEPGTIPRARIPLAIHWNGYPDIAPGKSIRIEYTGEGEVVWGDMKRILPPAYGRPATVSMEPPAAGAPLEIAYRFDDGSRSGQDPAVWGPGATFRVGVLQNEGLVPLRAEGPDIGWKILAGLADLFTLAWILMLTPSLWRSVRDDAGRLCLFLSLFWFFGWVPLPSILGAAAITAVLILAVLLHVLYRPFSPVSMYVCVAAAAFAILAARHSGLDQVMLRSAGNDPLQYESQSYSILATGSWRGGEDIFYFQPMFRYVLYLRHVLFGDADTLFSVPMLAGFWGILVWVFGKMRSFVLPLWQRAVLAMALVLILFLGGTYVSDAIRSDLSEYPAWILVACALPLLWMEEPGYRTVAGFAALTFSAVIRVNQFPAALWLGAVSSVRVLRRRWGWIIPAGIASLGIALLPLLHNVVYGGAPVPFTQGTTSAALVAVPPSAWIACLQGNPDAAAQVAAQLNSLFLNVWVPDSQRPIIAAMAGLMACWGIACGYALFRRTWRVWPVLFLPAVFLAPHLVYNVTGYYPKYIFSAYLCMGVVLPVVWMKVRKPGRPLERRHPNGVELPRTPAERSQSPWIGKTPASS
jgi:hypothetical protein